jgi:hypothetical protein
MDPRVIAAQWDRMGQFYASLEGGHMAASVAPKRLASCTAKNRFYRANRDLGTWAGSSRPSSCSATPVFF